MEKTKRQTMNMPGASAPGKLPCTLNSSIPYLWSFGISVVNRLMAVGFRMQSLKWVSRCVTVAWSVRLICRSVVAQRVVAASGRGSGGGGAWPTVTTDAARDQLVVVAKSWARRSARTLALTARPERRHRYPWLTALTCLSRAVLCRTS